MESQGKSIAEVALEVVQLLQSSGYESYYAGGAVRDQLLGEVPDDYDIASSATPDEILEIFPHGNTVGKHFGVILVKRDGYSFEIATFRVDGDYRDGRRPEGVTFSTAAEDAKRRDLTINGMFYDPVAEVVKDFVGGAEDLGKKVIRAIGEPSQRFEEDALRLLRTVRFSCRTGFAIEPVTAQALRKCAPLLGQISVERIQEEFSKIITSPCRAEGLELLMQTGLMRYIIPQVYDLIGCEQPPQFHPEGDVYTHTRIALSLLPEEASLSLCLSVLLHDIGKPPTYSYDERAQRIRFNGHDQVGSDMAREILTRLKYSNTIINEVCVIVSHHMQFMNVQQMRTAKVKRFLARETIELEMELHRVDCASSNGFTDNYDFLRAKQEEFANEPIIPAPLITGHDLIERGMRPGPEFKRILEEVQTEQLEGKIKTRKEALALVESL